MQLTKSRRWIPVFFFTCISVSQAFGTEKYAIAADASAVIVGELGDVKKRPSLNGWRLSGKIKIIASLHAKNSLPSTVTFSFVCSCCRLWPPPDTSFLTGTPGLWFLIPNDDGTWTSAGSCSDPGWRPIQDRVKFEKFFNERKR